MPRARRESLDLRPVFEMDVSGMHYIRAAGNYQQTLSPRYLARSFVKEMANYFRQSESSCRQLSIYAYCRGHGGLLQVTRRERT